MKALVIWCEMPETVTAYLLKDVTEEQQAILREANDTYVNSDDDCIGAEILSTAFGNAADGDPNIDKKWHGLWNDCEVSFPITEPVDLIICSGFYL